MNAHKTPTSIRDLLAAAKDQAEYFKGEIARLNEVLRAAEAAQHKRHELQEALAAVQLTIDAFTKLVGGPVVKTEAVKKEATGEPTIRYRAVEVQWRAAQYLLTLGRPADGVAIFEAVKDQLPGLSLGALNRALQLKDTGERGKTDRNKVMMVQAGSPGHSPVYDLWEDLDVEGEGHEGTADEQEPADEVVAQTSAADARR